MKDMIKFCMTKHEDEIQVLAKTPLGGQRFELLIRRWEMNNEPLPEESKSEKYVSPRALGSSNWLTSVICRPIEPRGWPEGRVLDAEEEDYFNTDDEEEYVFVTNQWPRGAGESSPIPASTNALKRKRRAAIGSGPKGYRPPLRAPMLGSLVDYGDEEEEEEGTISITKPGSSQTALRSLGSPSPEITPASPKPSHRQVYTHSSTGPPPRRVSKDEDDEDNLLESLVRPKTRSQSPAPGPRPQSPGPGMMVSMSSIGPIRPGEKRRRGDDDDEELMERLTKAKKPDVGTKKEKAGFGIIGRTKKGDDPPKKIKVKFGTGSLAVASSPTTPTSPETGPKDGDTG
jgi:protein phosphatase-4 regulatory subunit 3